MVRADGDALVMHVGERPYVVTHAGTLELSTHELNLGAMTGMLQQLLPAEQQGSLEEFGAVEHTLPSLADDRFSMVAARGGDDIWIEIRRRRPVAAVAVATAVSEPPAAVQESAEVVAPPVAEPESIAEVVAADVAAMIESAEPVEPAAQYEPYDSDKLRRMLADAAAELVPIAEPEPIGDVPVEMVATTELPVVEAVVPVVAESELDPVALLDRLIPAIDPDTEDMDSAFAAAAADLQPRHYQPQARVEIAAPAAALEPVEPVEPAISAHEYTAALKEDLADIAFADNARADVFLVEAPMAAIANPDPISVTLRVEEATAAVEPPAEVFEEAPVKVEATFGRDAGPSVVLPMTRSTRTEPARRIPPARTSAVERLLRIAFARGASSLFLTSDARPCIRVEGDIRVLDNEAVLSKAEVEAAVMEIVPQEAQESIGSGQATEWIAQLPGLGGVRCTSSTDHRGPGVVFTMIATRAATAEQLGLPREIQALATEAEGLVLVAGSRGSGKSTLMSALVDLVNHQRAEYVITLERQIRLVHDNHAALVSQREIRGGPDEVVAAARAALRENPDVLVVDDLSSTQMVPLLLDAAAGGLLVFVSITAPSTADAIERLLDLAPAGARTSVQAAMAEAFRGAVSQVLLKKSGGGRVVAREIMLATAAVTRLIEDGQLAQLPLALESGRRHGMVPLTDVLLGLVQSGVVDVREAFRKTHDRERLLAGLKREGIDISAVERLA